MSSYFTSTITHTNITPLNPSVDRASAIALLHDHDAFIDCQPLTVGKDIIETPPSADWIVTETVSLAPRGSKTEYRAVVVRVPFPPFGSNDITALSSYTDTEDGTIIVFQAPMGMHGKNVWTVVPAEDGNGFVLVEEVTMTGYWGLIQFSQATEKKSHTALGLKLARLLAEGKSGE